MTVRRATGKRLYRLRKARGQAAVETAIVMPFFVFLILGLVQLGLMHQARLMTRYAAFKAARAGSMNHAGWAAMDNASLAVLMPFASRGESKKEHMFAAKNAGEYGLSWGDIRPNRYTDNKDIPYSVVKICNPTTTNAKRAPNAVGGASDENLRIEFDDPNNLAPVGGDTVWYATNRTRLNVEVTFFYRLSIPFVNSVIWWMAIGEENQETLRTLRMNGDMPDFTAAPGQTRTITKDAMRDLAKKHEYVLPIRASYGLRMQSDLYPNKDGYRLPASSNCHVPWKRAGNK